LPELLASQGFGARQGCRMAVQRGDVQLGYPGKPDPGWAVVKDPDARPDLEGLFFRMGKWELPYRLNLYLAFHKPGDVECSRAPTSHRSVLDFFPEPFLRRELQPVGRLDADATGLLLFTDDGSFNHAVTSPRRRLAKTYRVGLRNALTPEQQEALERGVVLRDDPKRTVPARVEKVANKLVEITITEGRYHQIKRMLAAVDNKVESIHRVAIGDLKLGDLAEGQWRYLEPDEIQTLITRPPKGSPG
jgi:16S rRNA pseudouridine516 synthase